MRYKLGAPLEDKEIKPGEIVYSSFYNPENVDQADDKLLMEIKSVEEEGYTFSVVGEKEILEGDFGISWFYEAIPA